MTTPEFMRVCAVDDVPDRRRMRRFAHVLARDVLEERVQVDLLLVVAAHRAARGLTDDGDDVLVAVPARQTT